jgi:HSP20 family protein
MTLMRRPDRSMSDVIDRLLRDPFGGAFRVWDGAAMMPAVDVRETGDSYLVEAEIPGLKPENIDVEIDGNTVTIRGQYKDETSRQEESYLLRERRTGSFVRSIALPGEIDVERTTSSYENGELRIELPKSARARSRRIEVKGAPRPVGEGHGLGSAQSTSQSTGQPEGQSTADRVGEPGASTTT